MESLIKGVLKSTRVIKKDKDIITAAHLLIQLLKDGNVSNEAKDACKDFETTVNGDEDGDKCCETIFTLIEKFSMEDVYKAFVLAQCQYYRIKHFFTGILQLKKFRSLGKTMVSIAEKLDSSENLNKSDADHLMSNIKNAMMKSPGEPENMKTKTFEYCCFLCSYACFCCRLSKRSQAEKLYEEIKSAAMFLDSAVEDLSGYYYVCGNAMTHVHKSSRYLDPGRILND